MSSVAEAQPDHAATPSSSKVPTSPPSPSTSPVHKRSRVTKEADDAHVIGACSSRLLTDAWMLESPGQTHLPTSAATPSMHGGGWHAAGYDRWAQQRKDWTRAPDDGAHAGPKRAAIRWAANEAPRQCCVACFGVRACETHCSVSRRSGVTYDDLLLSSAPFPEPIALQVRMPPTHATPG